MIFHRKGAEFAQRKAENFLLICASQRKTPRLFALKTLTGASSLMRKQMKAGRQTLINVWATWCIPCVAEMPELEKMRVGLASRGIGLIGLNVDAENNVTSKVTP
jgi:thioredoxin-like negative regulator of GroEL